MARKPQNYRLLARIIGALSSESALKIFILLSRGEICVSDIAKNTGLSLSAASHQLRKMEAVGLILPTRTGRTICYALKKSRRIGALVRCLKQLLLLTKRYAQI